ncbi:DUF84 family protein [Bacillus pinisoli]|uniref:DUF84 family protein n=1 Tax=Bacillus pinisoli TaxID=2901866 RepID=UPI001FF39715|nr:DUF84 family protein [Bacillus pinisoli]
MLTITVGSKNFAKVEAVKDVFLEAVEIKSLSVPSDVSEQPFSDEETLHGAKNRAVHAMMAGGTDIGIGLEGGVVEMASGLYLCNWGALVDHTGFSTVAAGARIQLPDEIAHELRNGQELGPVMDAYAKKKDVRKLEGAIGIFTNEMVNRKEMFTHIVKLLAGQYEFFKK